MTLLGLVAIVRNESHGIERTLTSFRPWIDRFLIHDTGSTDGTPEIVQRALDGIPGRVFSRPFDDFSSARNAVLRDFESQHPDCPFMIMPDADDVLFGGQQLRDYLNNVVEYECTNPQDARAPYPCYDLLCKWGNDLEFYKPLVMRVGHGCEYTGRVHECLNQIAKLQIGFAYLRHRHEEQSTEASRKRWERDRLLLAEDLKEDPQNARAAFYLAQTHRCLAGAATPRGLAAAEEFRSALQWYERRIELKDKGFHAETFVAFRQRANMMKELGRPISEVRDAYMMAYSYSPSRAEPLYEIAKTYHDQDDHAATCLYAQQAFSMEPPMANALFVDRTAYETGPAELLARHAWHVAAKKAMPEYMQIGRDAARFAVKKRPLNEQDRATWSFYARSLGEMLLYNFSINKLTDFVPPHPFVRTNPSIFYDKDRKQWLCVLRTVNYNLENGHYKTPGDVPIQTENYMLELDNDLRTRRVVKMADLTSQERGTTTDFPVHGYEDLRVFKFGSTYRALACACDWPSAPGGVGQREQVDLTLAWPSGREDDYAICAARRTQPWSEVASQHQKNWMPVVGGPRAGEAIYSTHPLALYGDKQAPHSAGRLRGGSQAIFVAARGMGAGQYVAIVHDVVHTVEGHRIYLHRFVAFDPGLTKIVGMSEPFYFLQRGIEFCCGLAEGPDYIAASFSVGDKEAYVAKFHPHDMLSIIQKDFVI